MNKNEIHLLDDTNLEGFESRAMASLNDPMIMGQIVEGAVANIVALTEGKDYWITRAQDAETKVDILNNLVESHRNGHREADNRHAKLYEDAKAALEAFLDTDPDDEIVEALSDVLNLFGVESHVEWESTVTIKYTVSGTAPRGTSARDIDSWINFQNENSIKFVSGDFAPDGFEITDSDYYDFEADSSIN